MSLRLRLGVRTTDGTQVHVIRFRSERGIAVRWPLLGLALVVAGSAWMLASPPAPVHSPYLSWIGPLQPSPQLPRPWPRSLASTAARELRERFPRGSTLAQELRRAGVSADTSQEVVEAARSAIDPRKIRDGQRYRLYFDEADVLLALRYDVDRTNAWVVAQREGAWTVDKVAIPVQTKPAFVAATIVDTLDGALSDHVPGGAARNELIVKIADIYGWDVDFNYELRVGDRLDFVVQERWVEGEMIGYGDILAAEFRVGTRMIPVVRFVDRSGSTSYYSPTGESLRRAFLRSPVKYTRISSRFSNRRVHPVTGVARAHRGVDYAADPGTPVQATADGVIVEAGYSPEPGRYVKVRHGGSYSSVYMHFSRLHERSKVGAQVKQGDVIGYVGKTGNTTGYHVHYGLLQGGRYVDPQQLQMPPAAPVAPDSRADFFAQRDLWVEMLRQEQAKLDIAIAGAGGA